MRVCFVIDGLDEYSGDLNELCDLFSHVTKSSSIKILLSSRPIPVCCERFATYPQLCLQDLTGPDILKYVEDHLYSNSILSKIEEVEVGITIKLIYIITTRACGVFLWVVLVVRILTRQLQDYNSVPELLQEIDNLPADLEHLYDRVLGAIDPKYRVQSSKYLQLATLSLSFGEEYPMSPVQMYFAENEDYGRVFSNSIRPLTDKTTTWINKIIEGRLRSRCCGLLEVQKVDGNNQGSVVGFIHRTVVEFLQLGSNWQKIQSLTSDTKFDPEQALLSSALAELQSISSPVSDKGSWETYYSRLVRLFIYEKSMSEPLRQKFYQQYLPKLDRLLPKPSVDDPFAGTPERDSIIRGSFERGYSRLKLNPRAKLFLRCALSAPLWYLPVLVSIDHSLPRNVPREVYLLIHYVEEKDGLIRRHIVEAMSVIHFSVSDPVELPPHLAPLWTDRWHSSRDIVLTPWKFVLRYILAITTAWTPPDYFLFHDPQIVLALLDLVLLMLNLGADIKAGYLLVGYDATHLLFKLLSSIRFHAQAYLNDYELHREISRRCDDVEGYLTEEQSQEIPGSLEQPSEMPKIPYDEALVPQSGEMPIWQWIKSWVPWI
ncbi:P-loop containing protein [Fusarium beomiforme]|uniref:P-loop containing protein n=1 Tax=Fusarium beomiforme TaxID=44412 RepID=A0A9P5AE14_9HYPO|nr:P-loop containing protein [Fusarium beomiforme]